MGITESQPAFALLDLQRHRSLQSHSPPLAPSPPPSLCAFSFISCFSSSLELAVRAEGEVQIKLQLRSALLGGLWSWLRCVRCQVGQEEQSPSAGCDQTEAAARAENAALEANAPSSVELADPA